MQGSVIITGGAGGMGLACARRLGREHRVFIADMQAPRLELAAAELATLGIACDTAQCDITDRTAVDALVARATAAGPLAAVIHTAGLSPQMAAPEAILRVNALGTVNITEACLAQAQSGFALVNIASMAAHMIPGWLAPLKTYRLASSDPQRFLKKTVARCRLIPKDFYRRGMAYSLSKHFVIWYSRHMAGEFGARGARILSVSPGTFDTEMGRLEEKSGSMQLLEDAALKRPGRPEEIAALIAFCASDEASYLTGTDILCDGGAVAGREA